MLQTVACQTAGSTVAWFSLTMRDSDCFMCLFFVVIPTVRSAQVLPEGAARASDVLSAV